MLTTIEDAGEAPSLRVLYLYSNKIEAIAPRAFQRLAGLEYLDLRWNNLKDLAPEALYVSSSRWQLRLRANQIANLDQVFSQGTFTLQSNMAINESVVLFLSRQFAVFGRPEPKQRRNADGQCLRSSDRGFIAGRSQDLPGRQSN